MGMGGYSPKITGWMANCKCMIIFANLWLIVWREQVWRVFAWSDESEADKGMAYGIIMTCLLSDERPCAVERKLKSNYLLSYLWPMNEWMNENLYIAHKKLPHKTMRVHSARNTQCTHVSSRKLKLPKDTHTKKYEQLQLTHPSTPSQKWNYT